MKKTVFSLFALAALVACSHQNKPDVESVPCASTPSNVDCDPALEDDDSLTVQH